MLYKIHDILLATSTTVSIAPIAIGEVWAWQLCWKLLIGERLFDESVDFRRNLRNYGNYSESFGRPCDSCKNWQKNPKAEVT